MFNSFTPKLFQLHWKITGIQIFTTLEWNFLNTILRDLLYLDYFQKQP